ncbi:MAG: hypothetical protein AAB337_03865 [Patescibacteria group bacterium]
MNDWTNYGAGTTALELALSQLGLIGLMDHCWQPPRLCDTELVRSHMETLGAMRRMAVSSYTSGEAKPFPVLVCQRGVWTQHTDRLSSDVARLLFLQGVKIDQCERIVLIRRVTISIDGLDLAISMNESLPPIFNIHVYTRSD